MYKKGLGTYSGQGIAAALREDIGGEGIVEVSVAAIQGTGHRHIVGGDGGCGSAVTAGETQILQSYGGGTGKGAHRNLERLGNNLALSRHEAEIISAGCRNGGSEFSHKVKALGLSALDVHVERRGLAH